MQASEAHYLKTRPRTQGSEGMTEGRDALGWLRELINKARLILVGDK